MKLERLADAVVRDKETRIQHPPTQELLNFALRRKAGFVVEEFPSFKLTARGRAAEVPCRGWGGYCHRVLAEAEEFVPVHELLARIDRNTKFHYSANNPLWQLYAGLAGGPRDYIQQRGQLRIGLSGSSSGKSRRAASIRRPSALSTADPREDVASPLQTVHEAHVESVLAENPELIEPHLRLVRRQQDAPPVGRIDLLCKDKAGNFVVIELKKAAVSSRTIIDQVTRYMGWVRQNMAAPRQRVRGIVVVGTPDEKLTYSALAVPDLETKCWDMSIRSF